MRSRTSARVGRDENDLRRLSAAIERLIADALAAEQRFAAAIEGADPEARASARNLVHYLAFRQHDLRPLQAALAERGLSSLGRCEPHTLASLRAVQRALGALGGQPAAEAAAPPVDFRSGPRILERQSHRLLGPPPRGRSTRIMVTMPSEAAHDPALVERLVASGMEVMRINCAHDDARVWAAMVRHLHAAERRLGKRCRILVDLAGPKLRTGDVTTRPGVLRIKVRRDERGLPLGPSPVWLTPAEAPEPAPAGVGAILPVTGSGLSLLRRAKGEIAIDDARGSRRTLRVRATKGGSLLCEAHRTTYVASGAELRRGKRRARVADWPAAPTPIHVRAGDVLLLTADQSPGRPAGKEPARIPCTLPQVFADVRAGDPIAIDDGKLTGSVRKSNARRLDIEIKQTPPGGGVLLPDKGINFPTSALSLPGLTDKDLEDLGFAVKHAHMVGLSFAQDARDVVRLQDEIARRGSPGKVGIVLKIETRRGFEALPHLLLAGLRAPPVGVMVARGDLAVEMGFERLAEVQEEILWFCEAAHVPVVWATQVLESLSKRGAPSRAEVTDAAMAERAECVMLNKGDYVDRAVTFLDDVLRRMQGHQQKKSAMLRKLAVAGDAGASGSPRPRSGGRRRRRG